MFRFADCHAHINSEFFKEDYFDVLNRALREEVAVVNVGTNKKDSEENVKIAENFKDGVFATIGIHPTEEEKIDYDFFKKLSESGRVVAIGECGL
ncbi:MAG: TatD family hydrolase, partial [Candidatus Pacebacteria bacterium]|nr:TatD family hydrolase [Candidatus Paceibacterota bacterium]